LRSSCPPQVVYGAQVPACSDRHARHGACQPPQKCSTKQQTLERDRVNSARSAAFWDKRQELGSSHPLGGLLFCHVQPKIQHDLVKSNSLTLLRQSQPQCWSASRGLLFFQVQPKFLPESAQRPDSDSEPGPKLARTEAARIRNNGKHSWGIRCRFRRFGCRFANCGIRCHLCQFRIAGMILPNCGIRSISHRVADSADCGIRVLVPVVADCVSVAVGGSRLSGSCGRW
jgi:hypothetical protein